MQERSRPGVVMRLCIRFFGSNRLLASFLVAAPVLVLFLAVVAIFEMPLAAKSTSISSPAPTAEQAASIGSAPPTQWQRRMGILELSVRLALVSLVLVLLYIPIAWIFQFSRLSQQVFSIDDELDEPSNAEARAEFLGWLTAISVPYLILGFSMTIEFHALIESPTKGVGAIAAIMVLYALSVLASFLYIEVRELRQTFSREMRDTGEWLRYSFALANYQTPIGTPAQNVSLLLKKWVELLGRSKAADTDDRKGHLRQNLLGTLLTAYIKEESENICGDLSPDRMPIWVSEVKRAAERNGDPASVAFIATNVGFYAQYLSVAVKALAHSIPKEHCVVLITTTYVLPPFWWNWPYASEHHGIYQPIEKFRTTLIDLAKEDANEGQSLRVFRRMLVRNEELQTPDPEPKLSDRALYDVFASTFLSASDWRRMKRWRILKDRDGSPLTSRVRSPVNKDQLVDPIRWTGGELRPNKDNEESHVYWLCNGMPSSDTLSEPLLSYYNRLMHPCGGKSQTCIIDFATFRRSFSLVDAHQGGGLNGCPEITFIGTCERTCPDVWYSKPDLGLAFLSNMTKGQDSIFLAVVTDDSLVDGLWRSVRDTLNATVVDEIENSD